MNLYRPLTKDERDHWLRKIVDTILSDPPKAGADRRDDWERGWGQHAHATTVKQLIPGYFGKYAVLRHDGELVGAMSPGAEYAAFADLRHGLFQKYFRKANHICEVGCGTGHNLLDAHKTNPQAAITGLDWTIASQELLNRVSIPLFNGRLIGLPFNFFEPYGMMAAGAHVFTAAALEQTGDRFRPFIDWLIDQRPQLVLHIEPVEELLDETKLLDYLSIRYSRKRGYLTGFLTYLESLQNAGKIRIIEARRSGIGSLLIDGYQIVVWSPV